MLQFQMYSNILQMSVAVKKILYAADEKGSALAEAQEIVSRSINVKETEFSDDGDE